MAGGAKNVARFSSFEESDRAERRYYLSLSPQERIEILLELVERSGESGGEAVEGFARVHRIVELPQR